MSCLPYISLQPNYPEVFSDISSNTTSTEKVWLSIYSANAPSGSVHSKLDLHATPSSSAVEDQGDVRIDSVTGGERDNLKVERVQGSLLDLLVSTEPEKGEGSSYEQGRSARSLQPSVRVAPTFMRLPKRSIDKVLPLSRTSVVNHNLTVYPNIEAFDVSPTDNGLYVAGGAEGSLVVGNMGDQSQLLSAMDELEDEDKEALQGKHGEQRRIEVLAAVRIKEKQERERKAKKVKLEGHVGDVRSARFFPSGEVVMTTSSDLTTRIYSALHGSNPRTLTGHKRAVLCSGILGRGREVLTGAGDGTVRLYDVGEGKQKTMFGVERFSSVNAMALPPLGGDEAQTQFAVGLSSGHAELFDIRSRVRAGIVGGYAFPPGEPPAASDLWTQESSTGQVLALDWSNDLLVTGTAKGIVSVFDVRMVGGDTTASTGSNLPPPKSLLQCWKRNGSAINSIKLCGREVLVATADGLPYRASVEAKVVEEYAGWDCDNTSVITTDRKGRVVIAGSDGRIRRY